MDDADVLARFYHHRTLPPNYGFRLDERIIEFPWVLSRLTLGRALLLDAGSALNYGYLLDLPVLAGKSIVMYSLSPESVISKAGLSYVYGDLRKTILRDNTFDVIVCISTLEHIGMNNTFLYTNDERYDEYDPQGYQAVVREFRRLLRPGGKALVTVPYGRPQYTGWLKQFDHENVERLIDAFGGSVFEKSFYKYDRAGWQIADSDSCTACEYYDIHTRNTYDPDYAAAARAVACIGLEKRK